MTSIFYPRCSFLERKRHVPKFSCRFFQIARWFHVKMSRHESPVNEIVCIYLSNDPSCSLGKVFESNTSRVLDRTCIVGQCYSLPSSLFPIVSTMSDNTNIQGNSPVVQHTSVVMILCTKGTEGIYRTHLSSQQRYTLQQHYCLLILLDSLTVFYREVSPQRFGVIEL